MTFTILHLKPAVALMLATAGLTSFATGSRVATGGEKAGGILQGEAAAYRSIATAANIQLDA